MADTKSNVKVLIGLKTSIDGLQAAIGGVGRLATGLLGLVAAYASIRQLVNGGSDIVKLGAELKRLEQQTDITVAKGLLLRRMFEDVSIEGAEVRDIIQTMQEAIIDAGEGLEGKVLAFRRLNINLAEFRKMDPASQFMLINKRLAEMDDTALRTFTANEIFSEKGKELMPLFRNGGALDQAKKTLGEYPEVLERNAGLFERIETLMSRMPDKSRQFFAGLLDQTAMAVSGPLEKLNNIDLTPLGQRVGSFIGLAFQSFEDGTTADLVALSLEAGFEKGFEAVGGIMDIEFAKIMAPSRWSGLAVQMSVGFLKVLVDGISAVSSVYSALWIKQISEIKTLFAHAKEGVMGMILGSVNFLALKVAGVLNGIIEKANKIGNKFGMDTIDPLSVERRTYQKKEVTKAISFEDAYALAKDGTATAQDRINGLLDATVTGTRLLGAMQRANTNETQKGGTAYERLIALTDEFQAKREAAAAKAGSSSSGGGVSSAAGGGGASGGGETTNLKGEIILADSITAAVGGAFDYLEGRAVTFRSILADIGGVLSQHFQKGLVTMVVDYTLAKTKMFAVDKAFSVKGLVLTAGAAAKSLVSWIPAATAALVSSFGTAGAVALAAMAGLGLTAGFSEGGYTGAGGRWDPAGVVHRDEYVMDRFTTRAIGLDNLDYMRANRRLPGYSDGGLVGGRSGSGGGAVSGGSGGGGSIFVDDRKEALRQAALADDDMRIVDVIKSHRAEIFGA